MKEPKIIESYQVPEGNVSPDIFKLPCVELAIKCNDGNTLYLCVCADGNELAHKYDYIYKTDDGKWHITP